MSFRSLRVLAPIVLAGLVALAVVVLSAASASSATARGRADRALLTHCFKAVLGIGGSSATRVSGNADPTLVASLAAFRRTRSAADTLSAVARLGGALAGAGATTYDPSAAVLLKRDGAQAAVYAVPATLALSTLPADCSGLPQFADVGAFLALRALKTGSGPGACVISTQLEQSAPPSPLLPGATPPKPTTTLAVAQVVCESEAVLSGYIGALGDALYGSGTQPALIPDGVSAISYTLADGHRFTVPVAGNLATLPTALSLQAPVQHQTAAKLAALLSAHLPTVVTETGTGAHPIASLTRPVSLVGDAVGSFSFLRGLLSLSSVSSSSSSTSGSGASCSARNHRCLAVTVTTTCNSHEHCQTSRTIHRYRYRGAKPPAGTTGPDTQPTAPIVARTNRFVTRPTKLTLVLSGTPHRQVVILLSVSCFARNLAASGGGPPLQVAVPSRTPIALPGSARTFHACDVGALVTSTQRGSVHVAVRRG
jgi:hypothetical protein